MKRLLIVIIILLLSFNPVLAQEKIKIIAKINQEFSIEAIPAQVEFKTIKKTKIEDDVIIPQRSIITADVLQAQSARRWHKSGFIVCRVEYFITDYYNELVDLSDKNIYFIARKYEQVKGKDVAITGTEIVLSQAASLFAPGVDIVYFFTKGAIQRKKNKNWFKAGVSNAYENSICWFWLKGKTIELDEQESVSLNEISEKRALKLKSQIDKRSMKRNQKITGRMSAKT